MGGSNRPASVVRDFTLASGGIERSILAKMPLERRATAEGAGVPPDVDRPRLVPPTPTEKKFRLEFAALSEIHEHFLGLNDGRFGAVRVLDLLPEHRTLIMERVHGRTLRRRLYSLSSANRSIAAELERAFRRTGTWLRIFHTMGCGEARESRHHRRADYAQFIEELANYLSGSVGDPLFIQWAASTLLEASQRLLPDSLPLGLAHGDFAPRNVLVGSKGRVIVLDTLARYRAPIYEDIGYFLASLHCNWPRILSAGALLPTRRADRYESAFLSGYFEGERIPYPAIRLYETQALLDRWSAVAWRRAHTSGPWAGFTGSVKLALLSRFLRRRITKHLLRVSANAEQRPRARVQQAASRQP